MKMKTTKLLILLALLSSSFIGTSQTSFTLSTDVNSALNKGFAIDGGLNYKKMRFGLSLNQFEVPYYLNTDFETIREYRKSLDLTVSRFRKDDHTGLHYGIRTAYVIDKETNWLDTNSGGINNSIAAINESYINVGITVGYFWFPFKNSEKAIKGLYIEPNIGVTYHINKDDLLTNSANQVINKKPASIDLPRINVGYKFEF
mgnify:CR=1 FL=1